MNPLKQPLIQTLAFFDILQYPLTLSEIKNNLFSPLSTENISLLEIKKALQDEQMKNIIKEKNGFYYLANSSDNTTQRQARYLIAENKFKKAKKISKILSLIPYIKLITVCNSLAYNNANKNSDIDLFIVTAKNRIWTTRFLSVLILTILNLRPQPNNSQDKICLAFFVDEENLNLEKFKTSDNDIDFIYWTAHRIPIFDCQNMYAKFWQANLWIKKYLPNKTAFLPHFRRTIPGKNRSKIYQANWLEKLSKNIQLKKLNPKIKELANQDTRVVINDNVLKLYPNDRRAERLKIWQEKIKSLL